MKTASETEIDKIVTQIMEQAELDIIPDDFKKKFRKEMKVGKKLGMHFLYLKKEKGGRIAIFKNMDLSHFDFRNENLENAEFLNCNLSKASFGGAILKGAKFIKCQISVDCEILDFARLSDGPFLENVIINKTRNFLCLL